MHELPGAVRIAEHLSQNGHDKEANFVSGMACLSVSDMFVAQAASICNMNASNRTLTGTLDGTPVVIKFDEGDKVAQIRGKVSQAKQYITYAIEDFAASGNSLQVLFQSGLAYQKFGDYPAAIEKYEEALKTSTVLADEVKSSIKNNIGVCRFLQGNSDLAKQAFEEAVKTNSIDLPKRNLETLSNPKLFRSEQENMLLFAKISYSNIS